MPSSLKISSHTRKNNNLELRVIAELRSVYDPANVHEVLRVFDHFCQTANVGNNIKVGHIYQLRVITSKHAELWHKNVEGEPDFLVASIYVDPNKLHHA